MIKVDVLHSTAAVGTQILLTKNSTSILVDAGDGALRDLIARRFDFERLKGVLLTHGHFDHISGLYSLLNFLMLLGRKQELLIMTPRPSEGVRALLGPPIMYCSPEFAISLLEVSDGHYIRIEDFQIRAFAVVHTATSSLGYSVSDDEGFRVVISGDTKRCPSLEREVQGADIAILESTYKDEDRKFAEEYGHMVRSDAKALGQSAKRVVLIHASPKGYFDKIKCGGRPK